TRWPRDWSSDVCSSDLGQASDMEIQANEILRLRARINDMLAEYTGQERERIVRDTDRDLYMTAEQAVQYGLADEVLGAEQRVPRSEERRVGKEGRARWA